MGIPPFLKMGCTAFVITAVLFMEIFACVPTPGQKENDWILLISLIPMLLMPVPVLLMRCCGDSDGILASSPKFKHWAEFLTAVLFTSTIAFPVIFYATGVITAKAIGLSLGGVFLAVLFVGGCALVQARSEDDAFQRW